MKRVLFFFLLLVPFVEVWLLIQLSRYMPFGSIVVMCIVTATFGFWLMREEDFSLWTLMESEIQNHRVPTEELFDALLIWISGLLLVVPGLLSDALGFLLVVPTWRQSCVEIIRKRLKEYLFP